MAASPQGPSTGIGLGMALTIAVLAAAASVLAVLVVTRHHSHQAMAGTTTVHHAVQQRHSTHSSPPTTSTTTPSTTSTTTSTTASTSTAQTTTQVATHTVPSLSGDLQTAAQRVHDAGLTPVIHYVPSNEARGTVVAQSPAPGSSAPAGSQVTVNVSSGEGTSQGSVPNTVGMSIPAAVAAVNHAGFHLVMLKRSVTDKSQAGLVVAQSPAPGASAPSGSRVLVYMGAYRG